jgi:hypothetical protein
VVDKTIIGTLELNFYRSDLPTIIQNINIIIIHNGTPVKIMLMESKIVKMLMK